MRITIEVDSPEEAIAMLGRISQSNPPQGVSQDSGKKRQKKSVTEMSADTVTPDLSAKIKEVGMSLCKLGNEVQSKVVSVMDKYTGGTRLIKDIPPDQLQAVYDDLKSLTPAAELDPAAS